MPYSKYVRRKSLQERYYEQKQEREARMYEPVKRPCLLMPGGYEGET